MRCIGLSSKKRIGVIERKPRVKCFFPLSLPVTTTILSPPAGAPTSHYSQDISLVMRSFSLWGASLQLPKPATEGIRTNNELKPWCFIIPSLLNNRRGLNNGQVVKHVGRLYHPQRRAASLGNSFPCHCREGA